MTNSLIIKMLLLLYCSIDEVSTYIVFSACVCSLKLHVRGDETVQLLWIRVGAEEYIYIYLQPLEQFGTWLAQFFHPSNLLKFH